MNDESILARPVLVTLRAVNTDGVYESVMLLIPYEDTIVMTLETTTKSDARGMLRDLTEDGQLTTEDAVRLHAVLDRLPLRTVFDYPCCMEELTVAVLHNFGGTLEDLMEHMGFYEEDKAPGTSGSLDERATRLWEAFPADTKIVIHEEVEAVSHGTSWLVGAACDA